jgi:hypothetical protein
VKGRDAASVAGTAVSITVRCAVIGVLIANASPADVTTHLDTCSTCVVSQGAGR